MPASYPRARPAHSAARGCAGEGAPDDEPEPAGGSDPFRRPGSRHCGLPLRERQTRRRHSALGWAQQRHAGLLHAAHRSRVADHARLPFNIVVSNVPGQGEPLELVGRRVGGLVVLSMLTDALGIDLTVQGYRGRLHIGVVACPRLVPDVWGLLDHLLVAHEELVEAGS
ncbi:MAG: WSD1 family O-acyltransferase [Micrococcales bacterium]|nr:WSD1 family O-acyltransferase [Micrococcales bacterium]